MAPESFSLRCANLAKHSYQSPSQCIGTLAAIVPIELLQLCGVYVNFMPEDETDRVAGAVDRASRLKSRPG
jgi:hypothetical protein